MKDIRKEKIIRIREREESRWQRIADISLAVLLAGNLFAGVRSLYSILIMGMIVILLLFFYWLIEPKIIKEYSQYTDQLIREEEQRKMNS